MRHWMFASLLALASLPANAADLIDFWNSPRHGGNSFNRLPPDRSYFQALSGYGATWVRLSYDKWKPQGRDFLLGDADAYKGLSPQDLAQLKTVLDNAHAAGLKVVIAPLSLPGMRWSQNNQGQFDDRLWRDKRYWTQAATFWHDLAQELKDHPAVAAYNLINEPAPERHGGLAEHAELQRMQQWYAGEQGGPRDLPALYRELVAAIREVDATTPIMVDAGWYAAADAFGYWPTALPDRRVLYSVHMYEPYSATSAPNMARKQPIPYPGPAPFGGKRERWDGERVAAYLQKPLEWADGWGFPALVWWWGSSAECDDWPGASNTSRMSSLSWTSSNCTGPSTASGKTTGTAWTTNWARPRCPGATGRRSKRVSLIRWRARLRLSSSRFAGGWRHNIRFEIYCNISVAGIYTHSC